MHPSYISLALFAIGAIGAPSYPRPESSDPFDTFPFMTGSSTVEEDDDMDDPLPAAMGAMMQAEQVEMASYSAPSVKPTHMAAAAAAAALGSDAPVAKPDVMEQPQVPQAEPSQVATPKPEPPMPAVEASPMPTSSSAPVPKLDNFVPEIPKPIAPSPVHSKAHVNPVHSAVMHVETSTPVHSSKHVATPTTPVRSAMQTPMPKPSSFSSKVKPTSHPLMVKPTRPAKHSVMASSSSSSYSHTPTSSAVAKATANPLALDKVLGGLPIIGGLLQGLR